MERARWRARLTAGWLSNSRADALVALFSSAITAKMIKRFKSTCRSFSRRIWSMTIMHVPYAHERRLLEWGQAMEKEKEMTQKQQIENHGELSGKRIVVLGG